jgi:hypothetical protein
MKFLKTLTVFIFAVLLMVPNVYGFWSYNLSCQAFLDQCENGGLKIATLSLDQLIIDAAGFYIKSTSDYQLLLREIELSAIYGVDFSAFREHINKAIDNMELANATYFQIWQTSKNLQYAPITREKLRQFDYTTYQAANSLNSVIFRQVADLLKAGDVRGTYERAYNTTREILEGLKTLKISVNKKKLPKIPDCWRINQLYLEAELFGQYVSEVFFAVE